MKKTVLVTGATAGIGAAIADRFAKEGCRVIVTGRRKERLDAITERIKHDYQTEAIALNFDVRERQEVEDAIDSLPQEWKNIDVLVNNAGLAAGLDPIHEAEIEDWEQMIDTNVKGLLYVSRKIMPMMTHRNQGHIINIGSIAGKQTYPKGHVYCASKHAVDSLSKAMRTDLLPYGIRVTQIRPGLVETEFSLVRFKGDEEKASKAYEGYQPLKPEDVADVAYYATTVPEHVTLNDIEITPTVQANSFIKNI